MIVVALSATVIFYLAIDEPYVQRKQNLYVISMEVIYFSLCIAMFSFTDATDDVPLKLVVAWVAIAFLVLFFAVNILMSLYFACRGRDKLRASDLKHKERRRNEIVRRENEKLRTKEKRKRKKEAELSRLEQTRLEQLEAKRDQLRKMGYSEAEIDAKLPLEPV